MGSKHVSVSCQGRCIGDNADFIVDETPFVPLLNLMTDVATFADIHPASCDPIFLSRHISENAVFRLAAIINGTSAQERSGILTSIVDVEPSSILVPLVGKLEHFLDEQNGVAME